MKNAVPVNLILLLLMVLLCTVSFAGIVWVTSLWKRRMKQQRISIQNIRRSYCIKQWNTAIFLNEFDINRSYPTEEVFHTRVIKAAQMAYPDMTDWLKKTYPNLNIADTVFTCLLYAGLRPKELCGLYHLLDANPLYTRRSRLYRKLGMKVNKKKPLLFKNELTDLYVMDKM